MNPMDGQAPAPAKKPTLAELLARSMEGDAVIEELTQADWKLHDDDEGSSGG